MPFLGSNRSAPLSRIFKDAGAHGNAGDSFPQVKESIQSGDAGEAPPEAPGETSGLEQAIAALASSLEVDVDPALLAQIRSRDLKSKRLKRRLAKLRVVEAKMEDHAEALRRSAESLEAVLKTDSGAPDSALRFREEFLEWQSGLPAEAAPDADFFAELESYAGFLRSKARALRTEVSDSERHLTALQSAEGSGAAAEKVEEYRQQKESLEALAQTLLQKFGDIVAKSKDSFERLRQSLGHYGTQLREKRGALAASTDAYYSLKSVSDTQLSPDLQRRIEEHLKLLQRAEEPPALSTGTSEAGGAPPKSLAGEESPAETPPRDRQARP